MLAGANFRIIFLKVSTSAGYLCPDTPSAQDEVLADTDQNVTRSSHANHFPDHLW